MVSPLINTEPLVLRKMQNWLVEAKRLRRTTIDEVLSIGVQAAFDGFGLLGISQKLGYPGSSNRFSVSDSQK